MKKIIFFLLLIPIISFAQKKPLDHSVYDSWQSIGEKLISNDGKIVAYTINVQEGDNKLVIQNTNGTILQEIERGYNITISDDDKFVVFKIKPTYKQTRDAKIAKKKADDMPKDSLGIYNVDSNRLEKIARVKSYKMPEKAGGWLAYLMEKPLLETKDTKELDSATTKKNLDKRIERLQKELDSLQLKNNELLNNGFAAIAPKKDTTTKPKKEDDIEEGTELVLRNLSDGKEQRIKLVQEYLFSKKANCFLTKTTKSKKNDICYLLLYNLKDSGRFGAKFERRIDTLFKDFIDAKKFYFNNDGNNLVFVATFDTSKKEQKKYNFYNAFSRINSRNNLNYWKYDSLSDESKGIPKNWRINENSDLFIGDKKTRYFFGLSPILPVLDTSLPEFERVNVDVWNYKDDDLQTTQLKQLNQDKNKSYLTMLSIEVDDEYVTTRLCKLGSPKFEPIRVTQEGDGKYFYAVSDSGKRVEQQWQGFTKKDVFVINSNDGSNKQIMTNVRANIYPSYTGKYLLVYDEDKKQYSCYDADSNKTKTVAKDIPYPLYDEENDVPDAPNAYGIVKWMAVNKKIEGRKHPVIEYDKYVLIYDRYDLWKVDPTGKEKSVCITNGRKDKIQYRYVTVDNDEKFIKEGLNLVLKRYNEETKKSDYAFAKSNGTNYYCRVDVANYGSASNIIKSKKEEQYLLQYETFKSSANLFITDFNVDVAIPSLRNNQSNNFRFSNSDDDFLITRQLSNLNPQQSNYLWGSAELFKWKAYTGKLTEGILYKPENFDSTKKYPMIVYFYERNNQTLHQYIAPAPTPSRLNISYFVSNGYVVFVPDIWYVNGHPGKSAYDYIVSGTRALIKKGFIDSTRIGLQGQSWGGYQTAYLITQTNLYKAAWAGAPVGNMFSAYGGIRWESGLNRQFQYEHQQSRIGATIWEKPNLYIENSPLFHLQKVKTPLVIMANDADGAVPWYQGIELFTAMRRLNKPCWMLNYNGEAHNLMERKNRKDIQIKEQQFFDWLLKDAPAPKWITEGVPAVMKGRVQQ